MDIYQDLFDAVYGPMLFQMQKETEQLNERHKDDPNWVPGAYGPVYVGPLPEKRTFETGATRDSDDGKLDFEGFLSPQVLWAFAEYMHKHRFMADGSVRSSDNWQKGMPAEVYMKSLIRHVVDLWLMHRGREVVRPENGETVTLSDTLGGILFNLQGYWLTKLQEQDNT